METFVIRIFDLLKKRGKSAKEFAASIGVSQGNVTDWKSGRSKPSAVQIPKIAEFFGVSTDFIYYGSGPDLITKHAASAVDDTQYDDLPEEAIQEMENYREFLKEKYRKK